MDTGKLSEFDRLVLREFEGGDAGGGWGGTGTGGYLGVGGKIVSDDALYKAFIKPFVNVAKTAVSGSKAMVTAARTVIVTTAKAILEKLVPKYKANYDKTFQTHNKSMEKIKQEYAPVYKDIVDSMKNNEDFLISAFFFDPGSFFGTTLSNPQTFLTFWGGIKAPKLFSNLLSSLSGGAVDPYLEKIKKAVSDELPTTRKPRSEGFVRNVLVEADKKQLLKTIEYLTNPKLVDVALESETSKKMQGITRRTTQVTLDKIYNIVAKTMKLTDVDQIQSVVGEKIPEIEKLSEIPKESRGDVEQEMLTNVKNTVKNLYAAQLEQDVEKMIASGVPATNKLVSAYRETIKKIRSL